MRRALTVRCICPVFDVSSPKFLCSYSRLLSTIPPSMSPRLVQVNISPGGVPKHPVSEGRVTFTRIKGDDWSDKKRHGLPGQAICLYSVELIDQLQGEGFPVFPGALGENFTTEGIDYHFTRIGDAWRVGKEVVIRITKVRGPCRTITVYGEGILRAMYDIEVKRGNVLSQRWGRSGYYAEVLQEGVVRPGDLITFFPEAHQ
jgi:MOSC domain-containing protein YiiM